MADKPELVAGLGWRVEDARAVWRAFHQSAFAVTATCSAADAVTAARRLRLLAFWLCRAADDLVGTDGEDEAIAIADEFWIRNGIDPRVRAEVWPTKRGEGDAVE